MALDSLQDALIEQLKDLYSAEKQLVKALPKMAKGATNAELRQAIEEHLATTEGQVRRLEQVFSELEMPAKAKKCAAMEGLIEEGKEVLEEASDGEPAAVDAALIAAAQKVEHYEIGSYGTVRAWAEALGLERVAALLQETLNEESEANETLSSIAKTVNATAALPAATGDQADDDMPQRSGRASAQSRSSGSGNGNGRSNGGTRGRSAVKAGRR